MSVWIIVPSDSDLVHHGVKDQKWGVRNGPPYPLQMTRKAYKAAQKGVVTVAKGTAKAAKATAKATITVAKAAKKHHDQSKVKKQERKDAKEKKKTEKMKKAAISQNSYQKLYEMKDRLTYNELNDAKNRIKLEQEIYALGNPPKKTLIDYIKKAANMADTFNSIYKTGKNTWNNLAELYNSSDSGKQHPMRKIGGGDNKKDNQNNNQNDNQKQNKGSSPNVTYNFGKGSQTVFFTGDNKQKGQGNQNQNQQSNINTDKDKDKNKGKGKGKGKGSK